MTNNIYPPDHLLKKWEELIIDEEQNVDLVLYEAFQAGADQELEACCEWLHWQNLATHPELIPSLRAARRPNPPSLKEQALHEIAGVYNRDEIDDAAYDIIRRALEQLDD
jgi:hypothetical protein